MNYAEFLEALKAKGFNVKGKSFAFKTSGEWSVAFIRHSGRMLGCPGKIRFVLCARPKNAKGLERETADESKNPHDYPFKLLPEEIENPLGYESRILNYQMEYLDRDSDWSKICELLTKDLPEKLDELGVNGLQAQLRAIKNPGYIEKIWLEEDVKT
jgi:hypothetical protein